MRSIDNTDDIIDSRDVLARIEELENQRDGYNEAQVEAEGQDRDGINDWAEDCDDDAAELKALKAFEAEGSDEWRHGTALIRESHFQTYAQELAEEGGLIGDSWPNTCIDWEHAARELQYDYTGADFDGVTYYYRA